jgi:hypothetical protein
LLARDGRVEAKVELTRIGGESIVRGQSV